MESRRQPRSSSSRSRTGLGSPSGTSSWPPRPPRWSSSRLSRQTCCPPALMYRSAAPLSRPRRLVHRRPRPRPCPPRLRPPGPRAPPLSLSLAHDVEFITLRVRGCADLLDLRTPNAAPVGPTVDHLSTALANQTGGRRSGPIDVTPGGYPD